VILLLALTSAPALAVDFTVNSTMDGVDAAPGDGTCATSAGTCTVRAAMMEANALPGPDRMVLAAQTYRLTLAGAGDGAGDLDLISVVEIAGSGSTAIRAIPGLDRVLEVSAGSASVHDVLLEARGVTANPQCILATAPLAGTNLRCSPSLIDDTFESGDFMGWSAHTP